MKITLTFIRHEGKACISGQMSCNQIRKHGVTIINDKYGNDTKMHEFDYQVIINSFNLYVSVYDRCHILSHTNLARLVIGN